MKRNEYYPMTMIETRYLGPTNYRGARIVARNVNNHASRKVVPWQHELDTRPNHELAARALGAMVPSGPKTAIVSYSGVDGGGYIFVMDAPKGSR